MKAKIVCTYQSEGINPEIDEYLTTGFIMAGDYFIGSGYNLKTKQRDLEFELIIRPVVDKG